MEYPVFESRVMELLFKTNEKLTPQLVAFRVGCPVAVARQHLDEMTSREVVSMEVDGSGMISYDIAGRPPPTNQPLSWENATTRVVGPQTTPQVNIHIASPALAGVQKSAGVALLLTFFFGPLGMLYSTATGCIVMFLVNLVAIPITLGLGLFVTWPICMIWAVSAVTEHNRRIQQQMLAVNQQQLTQARVH